MENLNENVVATEVAEVEDVMFDILEVKVGGGRTIPTGDYKSTRIDCEIKVKLHNSNDYEKVMAKLDTMLEDALDKKEADILAKVQTQKEETQQITQSEDVQVQEYPQYILKVKSENLVVSQDPNFQMVCPKCGRPLRYIENGKYGPFYGCTGYNQGCKFSVNKEDIEKFFNGFQYPNNAQDMLNYLSQVQIPVQDPNNLYSPELQYMIDNNIPVPQDWVEPPVHHVIPTQPVHHELPTQGFNTVGFQPVQDDDDLPF